MKNMKYICMLVFVAVVHVVCSSIFFTFSESTKLLNQKIDTVQQLQGDVEQKVKAIEAANDSIKVKVEQHDVSDTSMEQQVKAISDTVKEVEQSVQVIEQARDKAEELVADANARATAAEEEIARIKAETNAAEMKSEATEDKKHLIEQKVKASNDEASKQVQQNVEQVAKNQQVILKQGNDTEFFLSSQIITIDNSYSISYLPLQTTIGLRFIAVPTKMPL
jgi:chromosome segregation ATPase